MPDVLTKKETYAFYSDAYVCIHGGIKTDADARPAFDQDLDEETLLDPDQYRFAIDCEHHFDRADDAWLRYPHEDPRAG